MTSQITTTSPTPVSRRFIRLRTLGTLDLSVEGAGVELRAVLRQPKRLALLAYLALAQSRGFHRRDSLVALFWPELDEEHARGALRQAVHFLRRHLGMEAIVSRGEEELRIGGNTWCDAAAFEHAASANRLEEAIALYRGDLLAGFHVSDAAPELDQWIESERTRLREIASKSAWSLALKSELARDVVAATHSGRMAMTLSLHNEVVLRQLVSLLDRMGDRSSALRVYEEFALRLKTDFDEEPSPETQALVATLRTRVPAGPIHQMRPAPLPRQKTTAGGVGPNDPIGPATPAESPPPVSESRPVPSPTWRSRRVVQMVSITAAATVLIATAAIARRSPDASTVLAVGAIRDHTGGDGANVSAALRDLLATNLARVPEIQVVSTARLYEVLGQMGSLGDTGAAMVRAARAAGATEVLEGALYRAPDGQFRLDLRRVDANAGAVRGAYPITGVHLLGVVDSATSALARDFNVQPTRLRVSDVSTTSLVAHRFYEEGLRLYYQGNARGALRLFEASVAEDSLFAMASYYVAMCNLALSDEASAVTALQRATAPGRRATEREGLLIRTHLAFLAGEPAAVAIAESLATRYPTEPDGHLLVGHSRNWRGDYFEAIPRFHRVLQMDSLAFRGEAVRCRACEAVGSLAATYAAIDSFAAAERLARDMISRGHGPRGWAMSLAGIFERQGNVDSALAAFSRIPPQTLGIDGAMVFRANLAIRSGNFEEADRILNDVLRGGMADLRGGALWWLSISLRYQGRLAEALSVARQIRRMSPVQEWFVVTSAALIEAQVLFELRRRAEAAALFDSIGRGIDPAKPARTARHRTWMLSHVATSRAAAGDTAELEMLADSMELEGKKSLYGRDPRLHHHVRGLLWRARGRPTDAEAAFRRAVYSPTSGYTRTNLELGRLLLEQRRPREAITILSPALRGPLDASNLYVTHTEIHELLARAFDDVGQPDSALIHYRWIERAWRESDPAFHARRDAARRRVAELDAQRETGGARS